MLLRFQGVLTNAAHSAYITTLAEQLLRTCQLSQQLGQLIAQHDHVATDQYS